MPIPRTPIFDVRPIKPAQTVKETTGEKRIKSVMRAHNIPMKYFVALRNAVFHEYSIFDWPRSRVRTEDILDIWNAIKPK